MSLYAAYIKEREGKDIIEDARGFATYIIDAHGPDVSACYIVDLYVAPEFRKEGVAKGYANQIVEIAKREYCTRLVGSVDIRASDAGDSMRVLLAYGMEPYSVVDKIIYFSKEI